jgi:hypothetical protein
MPQQLISLDDEFYRLERPSFGRTIMLIPLPFRRTCEAGVLDIGIRSGCHQHGPMVHSRKHRGSLNNHGRNRLERIRSHLGSEEAKKQDGDFAGLLNEVASFSGVLFGLQSQYNTSEESEVSPLQWFAQGSTDT